MIEARHFFVAVWPLGASCWCLAERSDVELSADRLGAILAATGGCDVLLGVCDAGVGPAKLRKELRRLPNRRSPSYEVFLAAMGRRLVRSFDGRVLTRSAFEHGEGVALRWETKH